MKKYIKKIIIMTIIIMILLSNVIFAMSSLKLYTGTLQLLRDATTLLMVIIPVLCGLCILIFQAMKGMSDAQEQGIWSKRTKTAIISTIVGFSASGIVNMIATYYGG